MGIELNNKELIINFDKISWHKIFTKKIKYLLWLKTQII